MSTQDADTGVMLAADGTPLKQKLAQAERAQKIRAAILVMPLLLFIALTFAVPILDMLSRSFQNSVVPETIPTAVAEFKNWDETKDAMPPEAVVKAFAQDFAEAASKREHMRLGQRLNYDLPGISSLFRKTGRSIRKVDFDQPVLPQLVKIDKGWGEPETWSGIKAYSGRWTTGYYVAAMDMEYNADGSVSMVPESERIYVKLFVRTLRMSLIITVMCLVLAYPVAYLLSILPLKTSNLLMIMVLLPFWTSLLARTSAWKVLLQDSGVINSTLVALGIVDDMNRLELIRNEFATILAMTHILLPFMILPLFSVMRTIPPSYLRAARSLGATEFTAFTRVYVPQTLSGIGAGAILVFILAIGYYITPEILGGTKGTFISNRIAYNILTSGNWGLGAALGAMLLIGVLAVYWLYDKIVGIDNVKLG